MTAKRKLESQKNTLFSPYIHAVSYHIMVIHAMLHTSVHIHTNRGVRTDLNRNLNPDDHDHDDDDDDDAVGNAIASTGLRPVELKTRPSFVTHVCHQK